jgi:hypothetical protein
LTTPHSANLNDAFFSEGDVAAAYAAADETMGHLQPLQQRAHHGGDWEGLSDDDLPTPRATAAAALDATSSVMPQITSSSDEQCERLVRLVNAAGGGDAQAIDELIEALEVTQLKCDV